VAVAIRLVLVNSMMMVRHALVCHKNDHGNQQQIFGNETSWHATNVQKFYIESK
jgi:hypothetical protein